ncbi:MAG: nuclear transport factor 2 family protein [Marinilabiliaceae bacterium]|nr:nuclear transport factor 2 family protein [Marinilabiliaceae bacterium]
MKQNIIFSFSAIILMVIGCQSPQEGHLTDVQKQQIKSEITQVMHELLHPGDTLHLMDYLSYYQIDRDAAIAMDGYIIKGRTVMRQYLEELIDGVRTVDTKLHEMHIRVVTKDVAIVSFRSNELAYYYDGDTIPSEGSYQCVFQRINKHWKIISSAGAHVKE